MCDVEGAWGYIFATMTLYSQWSGGSGACLASPLQPPWCFCSPLETLCRQPSEDVKRPLGESFGINYYLPRNVQKKRQKAVKQIISHFIFITFFLL